VKIPKPVTIDFETDKIEGRPAYPPTPVGVSIKLWGKKSRYYAWGHPSKNNCTRAQALKALKAVWSHKDGLLFQNGKFDVDVAEVHLGLKMPAWYKIHDTLFLLFLDDPHQTELGLKESAARLLDWPADERDAVMEWLLDNQPVPGVKLSKSKSSDHYWAAYISKAPGDLVGTYANGDVDRTEALFRKLWPKTAARGMLRAYDRERELMPILLDMERQGVPVDTDRLMKDVAMYRGWQLKIDAWLIKKLKADSSINLDSADQLVAALAASGLADPDKMARTAGGKLSTAKDSLHQGVTDKALLAVLQYRSQLKTCLNTFMEPWLQTAVQSKGFIFTNWNQVKRPSGGDTAGTRTGRLSSNPNFQNLPKEFKQLFHHEKKGLPVCPLKGLPPLPMCRSYIVPLKGHVLIDRDYSQQEPRILAHFEGGRLMQQYLANVWMDLHDNARDELAKVGKHYDRKPVKNTNLGLIYGMGAPKLAIKNDMSVEEARNLKNAILKLYPGLQEMYDDMKARAKGKPPYTEPTPIRTWGGREYFCEPPRLIEGRIREFDYKLVNVLIQGSAADCTKEAIIRFYKACVKLKVWGKWRLLFNVHDQLTASVPTKAMKQAMEVLRATMESVEFDVPILTEGAVSYTNWAELEDYDKKGKLV
jgi:DNA polymerase-1